MRITLYWFSLSSPGSFMGHNFSIFPSLIIVIACFVLLLDRDEINLRVDRVILLSGFLTSLHHLMVSCLLSISFCELQHFLSFLYWVLLLQRFWEVTQSKMLGSF